jgi:hypothetical protein
MTVHVFNRAKLLQNAIARNEVLKVRCRPDKEIPYARPAQNIRLP